MGHVKAKPASPEANNLSEGFPVRFEIEAPTPTKKAAPGPKSSPDGLPRRSMFRDKRPDELDEPVG